MGTPTIHNVITEITKSQADQKLRKEANPLVQPEPAPIKNENPPIWDLVQADMKARDDFGAAKYGTRLQANNGRDALKDAYQEILDAVVYLRQMIYERDGK